MCITKKKKKLEKNNYPNILLSRLFNVTRSLKLVVI